MSILRLIPKDDEDYKLASDTYKEIYNNIMAKGKGDLKPESLMGNPVQVDRYNYDSLLTQSIDSGIEFNDYYVNAKVDGERYMLLITNTFSKDTKNKSRKILFMDKKMNYYKLEVTPIITNIDKCLIDGEIVLTDNGIIFFAFDILYGPIDPKLTYDEGKAYIEGTISNELWNRVLSGGIRQTAMYSGEMSFRHGNSAPMIGPKAQGRWPTHRRLDVLNSIEFEYENGKQLNIIVSPSYRFSTLAMQYMDTKEPHKEIYKKVKDDFIEYLNDKMLTVYNKEIGRIRTDGLILTPFGDSYIVGSWNFCKNLQYKWKPREELTIDFEVGDKHDKDTHYAQVRIGKDIKNFLYHEKKVLIENNPMFKKGQIVESVYETETPDYIIFKYIRTRHDKDTPNAVLTAKSTLDTYKFKFKPLEGKSIKDLMDFVIYIKSLPSKDTEEIKNFLNFINESKIYKSIIKNNPIGFFNDVQIENLKKLIHQKKNNEDLELEVQIKFTQNTKYIRNCILSKLSKYANNYEPVPVVRAYKKDIKGDVRSTFAYLSDDLLIPYNQDLKQNITSYDFKSELYNTVYNINLSKETIVDSKEDNFYSYVYQIRNTLIGISKFWKVEIIEFGQGKTLESAKNDYDDNTKLRIEIEYQPGSYIKDIFNWENAVIKSYLYEMLKNDTDNVDSKIDSILMNNESKNEFLNKYINELSNKGSDVIISDLGNIMVNIYSIFDSDSIMPFISKQATSLPYKTSKQSQAPKTEVHQAPKTEVHQESYWSELKDFHNQIKKDMYTQLKSYPPTHNKQLFDTSVGHANDMFKWYKNDIMKVYGIDIDPGQIKIANERYLENKDNLRGSNYVFNVGDILTFDPTDFVNKYDLVVSNFTMHYFFKPKGELYPNVDKFVKKVASLLKTGSLFAGTTLIGNEVKKLIGSDNEYYKIEWVDKLKHKYSYQLKDKVSKDLLYTQDKASIEYLVDFEYLEEVCKQNNLKLIRKVKFEEIYKSRQNKYKLKEYQKNISFLNVYFIFQKN